MNDLKKSCEVENGVEKEIVFIMPWMFSFMIFKVFSNLLPLSSFHSRNNYDTAKRIKIVLMHAMGFVYIVFK